MDTVVHIFNEVMTILNWLAKNIPWDAVVASGVLTGLLAGPQRLFKKWFDNHEPIIITLIAVTGPTVVAAWTYILHHYGTDPRLVVLQGLAVSFMTQPFYFMVWKPFVVKKLVPKVAKWIAAQVAEAEKLNSDTDTPAPAIAAVVPAPPKVAVPIQDFKP